MLKKGQKLIDDYLKAIEISNEMHDKMYKYFVYRSTKIFASCKTQTELNDAYKQFSTIPNSLTKFVLFKNYEKFKEKLNNQI